MKVGALPGYIRNLLVEEANKEKRGSWSRAWESSSLRAFGSNRSSLEAGNGRMARRFSSFNMILYLKVPTLR